MRKLLLFLSVLAAALGSARAQQSTNSRMGRDTAQYRPPVSNRNLPGRPLTLVAAYHPQSIQLNAGSQGFGAAYNYGISRPVALRLGFDILPIKANNVLKFSDFNSTSDVKATFTNIHLLADYTPFSGGSWFRLVGGVAYFVHAKGNLYAKPSDTYTYGDIQLTPDQVGTVTFSSDWQGVAPYAGIGIIKMFPHRNFNINFDLGTYYLQQPKTQIVGTGSLSGNSSQNAQLQENLKDYRWLPVVQINFSYKL